MIAEQSTLYNPTLNCVSPPRIHSESHSLVPSYFGVRICFVWAVRRKGMAVPLARIRRFSHAMRQNNGLYVWIFSKRMQKGTMHWDTPRITKLETPLCCL